MEGENVPWPFSVISIVLVCAAIWYFAIYDGDTPPPAPQHSPAVAQKSPPEAEHKPLYPYPDGFDRSAETQNERKAFIDELKSKGVFSRVRSSDVGVFVDTGPRWASLMHTDKADFASAVLAYYWAKDPDHYKLTIVDGYTGKYAGGYSVALGLHLN